MDNPLIIDIKTPRLNWKLYGNGSNIMLKDALIKLPDFTKLKPAKTGKVYNISLNESDDLGDKFAILYQGEIQIEVDGTYTF